MSDFASEILRDVSNNPLNQHIFTTPTFSYGSSSSTVNVSIYDSDAIFMGGLTISLDSDGVQSGSGFSVLREGFSVEGSGWIIRLSGNVTLPDILPQGGRFRTHITHTDGVLSSTNISSDYFWDNDGTQSSINTSQLPQLSSSNNAVVTYSGIQYYTTGNIFRMSLGGINLLNDQTIPTSRQISIQSNNLPVLVSQFNGFADGSKPSLGSGIQGWELTSTSSGCTFAATSSMSVISGDFYPGFNGLTNSISFPSNINISANLYDWGTALSLNSINYDLLIDTYSSSSPANPLYNPIDGEYNRFTITGRTLSGYTSFTSSISSISLITLQGELQYIFGRIIYPQHNFSGILPVSGDYTGLGGGTFTFSVYTDLNTESKIVETFSDYGWYVSQYRRVDSNTFANGIFTFDSNWSGTDLQSDLVVILRISNDGFLLLSGDPVTYDGRTNESINNLDTIPKSISFTTGSEISPSIVWLIIGYKNSPRSVS